MNCQKEDMKWILLKFLKDSLEFLSENGNARKTKRGDWAETWMSQNLKFDGDPTVQNCLSLWNEEEK